MAQEAMDKGQEQQMQGEYLNLMAFLEYKLTLLIHDGLGLTNYHEAFLK